MKRSLVFLPLFAILCSLTLQAQTDEISLEEMRRMMRESAFEQRDKLDYGLLKVSKGNLITPEIIQSLTRVYSPSISPDGKWVLFSTSTPDIEENSSSSDLFLVPLEGGELRRLTASEGADYNGVWSPDGKSIAFLSSRNGSPQIYVISVNGGEAVQMTDIEGGVSFLSWSPDGKYFSFCQDVKLDETVQEKHLDMDKANVLIYDDLPVRHWDTWEDEKYRHLFIIPVDGGAPIDIMEGERFETPMKPFGGGSNIAWSPDGKEIAYTSKKVEDFEVSTNTDVFVYNLGTKQTTNISEGMMGFDRDPLYSPDGKWIAFHSMKTPGHEADRNRLMLYNRESGEVTELSRNLDQWVGNTVWAPNSEYVYFAAEDGATVQIYRMEVESGSWKIITEGVFNHDGGLDISPDGETIVYGRRNFNRPTEIYAQPVDGKPQQLTDINGEVFDRLLPATIEERWFTATDGKKFQSWVVYPPNFDPKKKYPLITYCQGGPQATVSQFFSFAWNFLLMASEGYVVVAPNRRGLPGFGQAWNDAISKDWGGLPMQDILVATDELLKEPYIDKEKAAAIGASAGGYAVFWLAGNHEGRFSAFVSHCGVFNLESMYGATEELWFTNWENGGPYWDKRFIKNYDKHSPHRYADKWDTPILIVTGELDYRVPYTQSLEAFTVAQVKGIPSKLIHYPNENHWVLHPQEQIIWHREVFNFLDEWCK